MIYLRRRRRKLDFANKHFIIPNGTDEYVNCGNGKQYDYNEPQSYIFCFKVEATDTGFYGIYNKDNGSSSLGIYIYMYQGRLYFKLQDGTNLARKYTSATFNDGLWHIVFITYNAINYDYTDMNIYVDNISPQAFLKTNDVLSSSILNSGDILLGEFGYTSVPFKGSLDEIGVVGKVLTTAQITSIIGNQTGDFDPTKMGDIKKIAGSDLGGLWRFEEGSGSTTKDSSSEGNDGTLINTLTWGTYA